GNLLAGHQAFEEVDHFHRYRHIHHEVGAGEGEDDRHFGLVGDQGDDTDALVVTVHQRQYKGPFLSLAEDAPHQIGALVAIEHRLDQLDSQPVIKLCPV